MGNITNNESEHWITTFKKVVVGLQKAIRAYKTPVDPSEYILEYGKIALNTDTGVLGFGQKEIRLRPNDKVFKIVKLLIMARGGVVTYENLIVSLGLPNKTPVDKKQSKISIGASVRDLRRRLDINSNNSKKTNPFIATGKGIKLAFLTK
ncbi:hypothetical protein ACFL1Q_02465 [Patescibacteria group bacterium]